MDVCLIKRCISLDILLHTACHDRFMPFHQDRLLSLLPSPQYADIIVLSSYCAAPSIYAQIQIQIPNK